MNEELLKINHSKNNDSRGILNQSKNLDKNNNYHNNQIKNSFYDINAINEHDYNWSKNDNILNKSQHNNKINKENNLSNTFIYNDNHSNNIARIQNDRIVYPSFNNDFDYSKQPIIDINKHDNLRDSFKYPVYHRYNNKDELPSKDELLNDYAIKNKDVSNKKDKFDVPLQIQSSKSNLI